MQTRRFAIAILTVVTVAIADASLLTDRSVLIASGTKPAPPAMTKRAIAPPTTKPAGEQIEIVDGDLKSILFLPAAYKTPADRKAELCIHFHGATWFIIDENLRRGITTPLLVVNNGEGSSRYAKPFEDRERFGRLIQLVEAELSKRASAEASVGVDKPVQAPVTVSRVDITSFSAGYGAVREILKDDGNIAMIRRVILCDSLYAGWDPATTQPGATSRPAAEHMQPFEKFVRMAAAGDKTFVFVHSSVETPYASTVATAKWLAEFVDAPRLDIPPASTPASSDPEFPLLYRADLGHLHIWGYGGKDAQAHMTHVRHLADIWTALDACGDR